LNASSLARFLIVELEQRLRDAGLRVTAPRVAVLAVLSDARDHPRIDQVLHRAALARRFEPAGSPARYEARVDNHHHLVCRACGDTADVDCAVGLAPCLEPSDAAGFAVDEAEVTFWGLCPSCQGRRTADAAA
jgi:Fur family transcriptional regulator, stress-responsive regulator